MLREYQLEFSDGARSIAIQTQFRDGEAQTVPYEPELAPAPSRGAPPEVAKLAFLRYGGPPGASLPAALQDVRAVEAARERARIEAALPPMTDEASFELRKALMEAVELAALRQREVDVEARNASALALIDQAVSQRAAERDFVADQRVEALRRSLEAEKEAALAAITSRRIRTMRKLGRTHASEAAHLDMLCGTGPSAAAAAVAVLAGGASSLGRKRAGRDIIADYANAGSAVYAPALRAGLPRDPPRASLARETTLAPGAPLALAGGRGGAIPELSTPAALAAFCDTSLPGDLTTCLPLRTLLGREAGRALGVAGGAAAAAAALRSVPLGASTLPRSQLLGAPGHGRAADAAAALGRDLERVHDMIQTVKSGRSTSAVLNAELPGWRAPRAREERPPTPVLVGGSSAEVGSGGGEEVWGGGGNSSSVAGLTSHFSAQGGVGGGDSFRLDESATLDFTGGGGGGGSGSGSGGGMGASSTLPPMAAPGTAQHARLVEALTALQAMLRGRAVQHAVEEGVARRMELIAEMRLADDDEGEEAEAEAEGGARARARPGPPCCELGGHCPAPQPRRENARCPAGCSSGGGGQLSVGLYCQGQDPPRRDGAHCRAGAGSAGRAARAGGGRAQAARRGERSAGRGGGCGGRGGSSARSERGGAGAARAAGGHDAARQ